MTFPEHPMGDDPPQVSDDDNYSTPEVSDDEDGGGLGRSSRYYHKQRTEDEEDIFAPEIHLHDNVPRQYFAWIPTLINNCAHSFVGGCAYVLIQFLSRLLSERHQKSTEEAIKAREEELQYIHYAATH